MVFTEKIKLGLYGFGNVAKGVLFAAKGSGDLAVTSVFTKRNPNEVSLPFKDINVYSKDELLNHKNDIDVLVMCGGSLEDLPKEAAHHFLHILLFFLKKAKEMSIELLQFFRSLKQEFLN